nr:FUSC family protein [Bordetella bronchiseptica]
MASRKPSAARKTAPRPPQGGRKASRGQSVRHLLAGNQLRQSLLIAQPASVRVALVAGLQAGLAIFVALVSAHLSPWPHLVGFSALGGLAALFGRFASAQGRQRIVMVCGLLLVAGVLVPSLATYAGAGALSMVLLLALSAGLYTLAVWRWGLTGGPGAVIFVFAVGAALAPVDSAAAVMERTLATAWGALVAWLACALTDRLRPHGAVAMAAAPLPPLSLQLMVAGRIAVGAGAAALIIFWAGWQYPAWAAIGAAAVMQGTHLHLTMNRSLQRMAGTIVGACIVWAILAQDPSFWTLVAAVVLCQVITEVTIGFNYALGQVTVTPMALLMTYMASPAPASNMPVERVVDTIVGAAIGIVFAVIFSTVDDRVHLARRYRKLRIWR